MRCPFCDNNDNGVVDSRMTEDSRAIRRRRKCAVCAGRFTTYERIEEMPLYVVKKDMRRQLFDRHKIIKGMIKACEKRPVATNIIESAAAGIEKKAYELGEKEIAAQWVGEQIMTVLRKIDQVAYVRFASVYRSFRDVEEFVQELERLKKEGGKDENRSS
jgi:transcriptional repressor NrdR